jgi:phosphoserine aminotransferase
VRDDLIGRARPETPSTLTQAMADDNSMLNTPPTFAWYMADWCSSGCRPGGLPAIAARNEANAQLLYATIDRSGFYRNGDPCLPSWMNVPFALRDRTDEAFPTQARAADW